jgi:cell fate (sporulation/competence/biofilm development) regulator YmcA (YheA/YmcA/DUF963 family)
MNKDEALKMAIEALNKLARLGNGDSYGNSDGNCIAIKTLKAIEEALEQPAQEPVAYTNADEMQELKDGMSTCYMYKERLDADCIPLYTHPHQWQGLTDDEIGQIIVNSKSLLAIDFYRAIEQALKERNHG